MVAITLIAGLLLAAFAVGLGRLTRNSRRPWKLFAMIGVVAMACISALSLLLVLFAFVSGGAMCGRYDFPPTSSPDGRSIARVTEEDCGAVDSFHSSVELWRYRHGISSKLFGNQKDLTTVLQVGHDPRLLKLEWESSKTLIIQYPRDSRSPSEFRCQTQWDDVRVECIAYKPDYSKRLGEMPPVKRGIW